MKVTLDIPDGIVCGFFNGVEITPRGCVWYLTSSEVMT